MFVLPANWQLVIGNDPIQEIIFVDEKGITRGWSFLKSNYPEAYLGSIMPNHSNYLSVEDIETPLSTGYLVVLERGYPAADRLG